MTKLKLTVFVTLVACTVAAAATVNVNNIAGDAAAKRYITPGNVVVYQLYDDATNSTDTLDPDKANTHGPFALTDADGNPQYAGFRVYAAAGCVASGDSIEVSYMVTPSYERADTVGSFTACDTIPATGKAGNYVSLSQAPGRALWIRVRNCDATGVRIGRRVHVAFLKNETFSRSR